LDRYAAYICLLQKMLRETQLELEKANKEKKDQEFRKRSLSSRTKMWVCDGECRRPVIESRVTLLCENCADKRACEKCVNKAISRKLCKECGGHLCRDCFAKMPMCDDCEVQMRED